MAERYKTLSAVFPIILRGAGAGRQILLHRRANTGYMDGYLDIAGSGHVDEGETARQAVARECREELGIDVREEDVEFAHLSHRVGLEGLRSYYDIYFFVRAFEGNPRIGEPDKCTELGWFALENLPRDLIPLRRRNLQQALEGTFYSEMIQRP